MKKNQVITRVGSVLVMVENDKTPTDGEWDEFLAILAEHRHELEKFRLLVMTAGGGPNQAQRKRLAATLSGAPMRVAVVSDNVKTRFIASTIALFHRDHRSFTNAELQDAYAHLELTPVQQRQVESAIKELSPMVT